MLNKFGKIIQFHRKQAGITQKQLADLAGIGKTAVFNLEKGNSNFRIETLIKICKILNITIDFQSPLMEEWRKHES
ncbi:MAG: helix-turn-helix transcriptional regulator [Candidatus Celaenobacter antarcticus]|nr:helix-turn-helix transcriptional regulator [Candidatus Celaenobacter antarcticus]MDP8314118.1 helix-turn-helix transcriptional regulator [Candidatus Celaenobacter antarcticus]